MKIRAMTDEEARAEIEKQGGYAKWKRKSLDFDRQDLLAEVEAMMRPVAKSDSQIFCESVEILAKREGLDIDGYFAKHPEEFQKFRQRTSVQIGLRVKD